MTKTGQTVDIDNKSYNYDVVDYFKFFFALCIVAIHTPLWGGAVYPLLLRLAVPYFFVASGFFVGLKVYCRSKVNWYAIIRRLLVKLLIFEPISISLILLYQSRNGYTFYESISIVVKHIIFYPYGALWYIQALIIAFLIISWAIKYKKLTSLLVLSLLGYFVALIMNNYYFLIVDCRGAKELVDNLLEVIISPRNGLFVGLLFVLIGMKVAEYKNMFIQNKRIIILLFCISYVFLVIESFALENLPSNDDGGLYLLYVVVVPLLFAITISISRRLPNSVLLRNLSTSIYLMHRPLLMILYPVLGGICVGPVSPELLYVLTVGICIVVSLVIFRFKITPLNRWLS